MLRLIHGAFRLHLLDVLRERDSNQGPVQSLAAVQLAEDVDSPFPIALVCSWFRATVEHLFAQMKKFAVIGGVCRGRVTTSRG